MFVFLPSRLVQQQTNKQTGGPPALVAVRSGRVGVARASKGALASSSADAPPPSPSATSSPSSSPPPQYTAAGPGASFGAADLLAGRPSRSDVIALGEGEATSSLSSSLETTTTVLRVTPSILASLAAKFPGAERALLQEGIRRFPFHWKLHIMLGQLEERLGAVRHSAA